MRLTAAEQAGAVMSGGERTGPRAESPAALLLREFVNTLDVETAADAIGTPAELAGWLAARGLVPAGTPAGVADLATAAALREGLRAAMLAHHSPDHAPGHGSDDPGPGMPDGLEDALGRLPLRLALAAGRPALVPSGTGTAAGLARIAAAVMDAVADGTWPRLKVCQESTCLWAFLDTSKNRSRAWCSMRVCGNRTKTRTYRARRRTPAP
ncbi:CGNR zinc finger domain-containing protein [Spirillospora sp. NPDC029432]|uniref:CGNR zinc finger domain-containing protein n=1 Tax=Spirillospora sp. NPDC029432 TaxID=3154599 RepID=UPI0034549D74